MPKRSRCSASTKNVDVSVLRAGGVNHVMYKLHLGRRHELGQLCEELDLLGGVLEPLHSGLRHLRTVLFNSSQCLEIQIKMFKHINRALCSSCKPKNA